MYIGNFAGHLDELLIQGEVMTDFSNGLSAAPEPGTAMLASIGLATLSLMRRRRKA